MCAVVKVIAEPRAVAPLNSCNESPATAKEPVVARLTLTTNTVSSVKPALTTSPMTLPASSATVRIVGAAGAVVSMVTSLVVASTEVLPCASVTVATTG